MEKLAFKPNKFYSPAPVGYVSRCPNCGRRVEVTVYKHLEKDVTICEPHNCGYTRGENMSRDLKNSDSWRDAAVAWQHDVGEALGMHNPTKTRVLIEIERLKRIENATLEMQAVLQAIK